MLTKQRIALYVEQQPDEMLVVRTALVQFAKISEQLEQARERYAAQTAGGPRVIMALLAQQIADRLSVEDIVEKLYSTDELALELGARTVFQDEFTVLNSKQYRKCTA